MIRLLLIILLATNLLNQDNVIFAKSNALLFMRKYEVFFKNDSYSITTDSQHILNHLSDLINNKSLEISEININGHTNTIGNEQKNLKLSKQRALEVKKHFINNLTKKNVQIKLQYKGENQLKHKVEQSQDDYAENRRVIIELTEVLKYSKI